MPRTKLDPIIEAALINAAATIAVEANAFTERNLRAVADMVGPNGLPVIDESEYQSDPVSFVASAFGRALTEVRFAYEQHLSAPYRGVLETGRGTASEAK